MLQFISELIVQIAARAVGVIIAAAVTCIASGFRRSYIAEWKRLFSSPKVRHVFLDLLGLVVILGTLALAVIAVVLLGAHVLGP